MTPDILAFDHVHVFVRDHGEAQAWYRRVLGFTLTPELEFWAADGGPLTIQNASGTVHIALFERGERANKREPLLCRSTIALRVDAAGWLAWREHLARELPGAINEEDHVASMSLYFNDPDGNPYEITTYDVAELNAG
jgi:catechol-2,3-dioxygenase